MWWFSVSLLPQAPPGILVPEIMYFPTAFDSEAGKGTRFHIYLPLTLAVTQAVLVRSGNRRYAIPSSMVPLMLIPTADGSFKVAA